MFSIPVGSSKILNRKNMKKAGVNGRKTQVPRK